MILSCKISPWITLTNVLAVELGGSGYLMNGSTGLQGDGLLAAGSNRMWKQRAFFLVGDPGKGSEHAIPIEIAALTPECMPKIVDEEFARGTNKAGAGGKRTGQIDGDK